MKSCCLKPLDLYDPRCQRCLNLSRLEAWPCGHQLQRQYYEMVFNHRPSETVLLVSYTPRSSLRRTWVIYTSDCSVCQRGGDTCLHAMRRQGFEGDLTDLLKDLWFYPISFSEFIGISRRLQLDPELRNLYLARERICDLEEEDHG